MKTKDRLILEALETVAWLADGGEHAVKKLRDHLEAEGAPVPSRRPFNLSAETESPMAALARSMREGTEPPPVQSAPPGLWVAHRWTIQTTNEMGEAVRWWLCSDCKASVGEFQDGSLPPPPATPCKPIDQPAAPPTSGAGEANCPWCVGGYIAETGLLCRTCHGTGGGPAQPAPQPSGNPGELPDVVLSESFLQRLSDEENDSHGQPEPQRDGAGESFWRGVADQRGDVIGELSGKLAVAEKYSAIHKALAKRCRAQRASAWRTVDRNLERSVELANVVANLRVEIADLKRAAPVQDEGGYTRGRHDATEAVAKALEEMKLRHRLDEFDVADVRAAGYPSSTGQRQDAPVHDVTAEVEAERARCYRWFDEYLRGQVTFKLCREYIGNGEPAPPWVAVQPSDNCLCGSAYCCYKHDLDKSRPAPSQPAPVDVIRGSDGGRRLALGWIGTGDEYLCTGPGCAKDAEYHQRESGKGACGTCAGAMGVFATEAPPQALTCHEGCEIERRAMGTTGCLLDKAPPQVGAGETTGTK